MYKLLRMKQLLKTFLTIAEVALLCQMNQLNEQKCIIFFLISPFHKYGIETTIDIQHTIQYLYTSTCYASTTTKS